MQDNGQFSQIIYRRQIAITDGERGDKAEIQIIQEAGIMKGAHPVVEDRKDNVYENIEEQEDA